VTNIRRRPSARRRADCISIREARPGIYHNTAAIFDSDGSLRGLYRKMHIPDDPSLRKVLLHSRHLGFRALDTRSAASAPWSAGINGFPKVRA